MQTARIEVSNALVIVGILGAERANFSLTQEFIDEAAWEMRRNEQVQ
jgi:hypothetical protein